MDIQLLTPPWNTLGEKGQKALTDFATTYELSSNFDGGLLTPEVLASGTLYGSVDAKIWDTLESDFFKLNQAGVHCLLHTDASSDSDSYEWSHKSYSLWVNKRKLTEHPAGSLIPEPLIPLSEVLDILENPESKEKFLETMALPTQLLKLKVEAE